MSKLIVKVSDFSTANLSVGPVKSLESGGKMATLGYNGAPLITQIGPLSLPYGMNVFDKAGPVKYSMDLSLRGYQEDENVKAMYTAFAALDEWMIDQGQKNSKAWFKADLTKPEQRGVVQAFYTPMVKFSKDAEGNVKPYPPTVKVNLRKDRNNTDAWEVKVYERVEGEAKKVEGVPLEDLLVKGAQVTTLIQCTSVWFAGSKFGLSWKANQIRMESVPDSIRGYAFIDDAPASTGPSHPVSRPSRSAPAPAPTAATPAANKFSNLDDEEVEDDDAFDAPTVTKKAAPSGPSHPVTAPAPVAVTVDDEDAEDHEPVPVPAKKTTTVKKVVKQVKKA
jgi:hypothetical protein